MNGDANPVSSLMSILTQINDYFSTETNLQNFSTWRCFFVLQLGKVLHRLSRCKVKAIRKTNQMIYPTVRFVTVCHQMRVLCLENCLNFSNFLFSPQHAIDHNRRGTSTEQAQNKLTRSAYDCPDDFTDRIYPALIPIKWFSLLAIASI